MLQCTRCVIYILHVDKLILASTKGASAMVSLKQTPGSGTIEESSTLGGQRFQGAITLYQDFLCCHVPNDTYISYMYLIF
jgi:hypothetical protein